MKLIRIPESSLYGHDVLDAQHQQLFSILEELSSYTNGDEKSEINKLLDDFFNLLKTHCRDEEKTMTETGYPGVVEHSRHHKKLAKVTKEHISSIRSSGRLSEAHIHKFADGILRHMLSEDGEFHTFLYKKTKKDLAPEAATLS